MPFIDVTLAKGRSPETLRAIQTALHDAMVEVGGADSNAVTVVLREVEHDMWATGDRTIAERNAAKAAASE
ncbi:hypothetical protein F8O01_00680 [Pseudoclavibacter chungangensis]|uniref:4-oxalocrotonate tautomerase-like domain-containing protein n=1 Tax=Pseudoclavibacter chungangensis TaxID=587635 RepID=A0A7J5C1I2_9MICO|nr:tautomerase family protein [Pseudoclavibacter chungangensis]KAB1662496.1 hypothetical protein F8O01_00680 [Pseudoclavibacter chungangensis]NYJ68534.1 4-oxalocrotonate tautomerase [Pseudoclavibacter chungangensis]